MKRTNLLITAALWLSLLPGAAFAKGVGTSGGTTLLEPTSARASALGEAYTASLDDIAGFGYNPASLDSLKSGQASFLYQKGLVEDSYGHFMIGGPTPKGSLGLSIGFYDGGKMDAFDGTTARQVTAQRDMTVSLGYATQIGGLSIGMTGKYLTSELIESEKASAFAGDFGLSLPVMSRLRIGAAVQNIGTQLKFIEEGDNLPRIARAGMALTLIPKQYVTTLMVDAPYYLNEQEMHPSVGLEVMVGMLSLRAGYKAGSDLQEFSVGTGFMLGKSSLDYSFGMADKLDAQHRVSLSMRFGGTPASRPIFAKQTNQQKQAPVAKRPVKENTSEAAAAASKHTLGEMASNPTTHSRRVYTVKDGDTLATIAARTYGDRRQWKSIYTANKHLIDDPANLEVGQKIVIP